MTRSSLPSPDWALYVITDHRAAAGRPLLDLVRAALRGGATVVQLRMKHGSTREMLALGQELREVTRLAGVPLIVNDRLDVALALEAEGVHLGQEDLPARLARPLIGPNRLLGVSVETVEQAEQAWRDGADYLGVGDLFGTPSKPDAGPPIGLEALRAIARAVPLPIVGIGGVTLENAGAVIDAGAAGVAVISAVIGAADPEQAARDLRAIVEQRRRQA
jgi:thiamine-phosphate pyrophosphorylase